MEGFCSCRERGQRLAMERSHVYSLGNAVRKHGILPPMRQEPADSHGAVSESGADGAFMGAAGKTVASSLTDEKLSHIDAILEQEQTTTVF